MLFGVTLFHCSVSLGQAPNTEIARIRKVFSEVNSDTRLKKVVLDAEDFLQETPDGGASLTGYFSKTSLVKITSWIGLSYGIQQIDFYFDGKGLIFCYVSERHFKLTDAGTDLRRTNLVFEGRYYFKNDKLLQTKRNGSGFWDKESEAGIIPNSKEYYKILMTKKYNAS